MLSIFRKYRNTVAAEAEKEGTFREVKIDTILFVEYVQNVIQLEIQENNAME